MDQTDRRGTVHADTLTSRPRLEPGLPSQRGPSIADGAVRERALTSTHPLHLASTAAMRAQTRDQGRYLGGRPPYGYRLVDAGPHPNRAHARWGRRLQRLDPDPRTAGYGSWIFTERNPHRRGQAWTASTVTAILGNPRYTGRQVWNRQRTDHYPLHTQTGHHDGDGRDKAATRASTTAISGCSAGTRPRTG
jgi:Recombinase